MKKVFIEKITGASIINRVPLKIMIPISSNKISKDILIRAIY